MAKGALRQALDDTLRSNPLADWLDEYFRGVSARTDEVDAFFADHVKKHPINLVFTFVALTIVALVYIIFNQSWLWTSAKFIVAPELRIDASVEIAKVMTEFMADPRKREIFEALGSIVTDGVVDLFESYAGDDQKDPKEFARAFHGFMAGLTGAGGVASTAVEVVSMGQIENAGQALTGIYWSLGLGFLGWQTLAPLLGAGLQPGLERYYNRKYRPQRFSAGDLRDLYALGKIGSDELRTEAQNLGWREQDIQHWIDLSFKTLSENDIFDLLEAKALTPEEAVKRIAALGYDPADIPLIFKLHKTADVEEAKTVTLSTARSAFKDGLIGEDEFRSILRSLKRSEREIELIVALERQKQQVELRALTVSQLRAAWEENVVTDAEARYWLAQNALDQKSVEIILLTWKAQISPTFRKLNVNTVTAAYVEGILDRAAAYAKLRGVGFSQDDARLELDLVEARNPLAFGRPQPKPTKFLAPSMLIDLVEQAIITPDVMQEKLIVAGYPPEDAERLTELARREARPQPRLLDPATVVSAYVEHVFDRDTARDRLLALGFTSDDVSVRLTLAERQNPEAFLPEAAAETRLLSIGQLTDLLAENLITDAFFRDRLLALNYTSEDADRLLQLARRDIAVVPRELTQATIERAYIAQVINRHRAVELLTALEFPAAEIAVILSTVEKENPQVFAPETAQSVRQPTVTALVRALQNGIIDEAEYFRRMAEAGYDRPSAQIYLSVAIRNERTSAKTLTASQVVNAYGAGIFTRGEAQARLIASGYNDADSTVLLRLEKSGIEETEVWSNMLAGLIAPEDAVNQLLSMGFSIDEINTALRRLS